MTEFLNKYSNLLLSEENGKELTLEVLSLIASNISDMQIMSKAESIQRGDDIKEFIFDYRKALKRK